MPGRHPPIQFSGDIAALAHTLRMPVDEIIAVADTVLVRPDPEPQQPERSPQRREQRPTMY